MLRCVIICPDRDLGATLERSLREVGHIGISRVITQYPSALELSRVIRAHGPQLVFLSIESLNDAIATVGEIDAKFPGIQTIAIHRTCDPHTLLDIMRAGVREFVALPFPIPTLRESLLRVAELIDKRPPQIAASQEVFTFLPSKAGVGTTTIALHASMALASLPETKVLLSDFDLNSGMIRFMLKIDNTFSVTDAVERALEMDENVWPQLVTNFKQLDVLHAGRLEPGLRIEPAQIRHLLDFMRRNYDILCFDLSGNLEKYSLELMQESKRIMLVCTPELPSLHLAREKVLFLRRIDLHERVTVLLNRCPKHPMITPAQVEEILGMPVQMTLTNDYHGLHKALTLGRTADPKSELGYQFAMLAKHMTHDRKAPEAIAAPARQKRGLLDYLPVLPKSAPVQAK